MSPTYFDQKWLRSEVFCSMSTSCNFLPPQRSQTGKLLPHTFSGKNFSKFSFHRDDQHIIIIAERNATIIPKVHKPFVHCFHFWTTGWQWQLHSFHELSGLILAAKSGFNATELHLLLAISTDLQRLRTPCQTCPHPLQVHLSKLCHQHNYLKNYQFLFYLPSEWVIL